MARHGMIFLVFWCSQARAATPGIGNNNTELVILMVLVGVLLGIVYGIQQLAKRYGAHVRQWFTALGNKKRETE